MTARRMSSSEVRAALLTRFPVDQYLSIPEAPMHSDRGGRKLDVLVLALWKSRGLAVDGVEIKVSMSDFRRELAQPEKADWWWQRCDRFWIAAPSDVAKKIQPELPPAWGLLSCTPSGVRALVQAPRNPERQEIPWPTMIGLFRAAADAGTNALLHARRQGYDEGLAQAKTLQQWNAETTDSPEYRQAVSDLERLRESVAAFEEASGLRLERFPPGNQRLGAVVRAVQAAIIQGPETIDRRLGHQADQMRAIAGVVDTLRTALADAMSEQAITRPDRLGSHEEAPPT